jgi:hypothetical protein
MVFGRLSKHKEEAKVERLLQKAVSLVGRIRGSHFRKASSRRSNEATDLQPSPLLKLPDELLLQIIGWLHSSDPSSYADMISSMRTVSYLQFTGQCSGLTFPQCRLLFDLALCFVYSSVELRSTHQAKSILKVLQKYPKASQHVKKLVIQPALKVNLKGRISKRALKETDEAALLEYVESILENTQNLQVFIWDGLDMPNSRSLWLKLES